MKSIIKKGLIIFAAVLIILIYGGVYSSLNSSPAQSSTSIITPEAHFGFKPGTDRMMFDYEELISYLQKLDAASARLKLVEIGRSPQGRPMYIAFISSEENISNLERLREINRKLALEPDLGPDEKSSLVAQGKVFFLATLSMHSDEVGPSQAAPLIAYELVTTEDPQEKKWLSDVVYMMVPNHNPDGMDMQVHHYRKYKGTKYEGCSLPGVYHQYVGHDNNRDYLTLTQSDTKAIARIYNLDWFPQVMVDKHQMYTNGPRYFVPPVHDPISENVDAGIWNWTKVFGSNMITDMTEAGLAGVCHSYVFDDYWPGSTETSMWKGVISMLTEMASAKDATPVFVEPNELEVEGKGLSEYKMSINMPLPWPGGWWRLSEMLQYEIVSTKSIIKTASLHRKEILEYRHDLCRREVEKGRTQPPFYYALSQRQPDESELVSLVNLLQEHGVRVFRLKQALRTGDISLEAGDIIVPLAQPFRSFIKEVMEKQEYPARHYTPDGELIKPYDITSWSLPWHRGLKSWEIKVRSEVLEKSLEEISGEFSLRQDIPRRFFAAILTANNNESYKAAFQALKQGLKVERLEQKEVLSGAEIPQGSFLIPYSEKLLPILESLTVAPRIVSEPVSFKTSPVRLPRIALVETYFHDMDAGWTRYIFDTYSIPFTVVRPGDFEKTDFAKNFDLVVFPDAEKSVLMEGKYQYKQEIYLADYPPEFTKGIGAKGMEKLMTFLDSGGIIISWGASTSLFMGKLEIPRPKVAKGEKGEKGKEEKEEKEKEEFQLPVRDDSEALQKAGLYCPASLLRIILTEGHPLTLGLPSEIGVIYTGKPAFQTSVPIFDMDRRVIGRFPEKDILLSGYAEKVEKVGNKTSVVWLKKGRGQLVLFAFSPIFRASTQVAFKLLFNALLLPKIT
jgi:hypothetical protein